MFPRKWCREKSLPVVNVGVSRLRIYFIFMLFYLTGQTSTLLPTSLTTALSYKTRHCVVRIQACYFESTLPSFINFADMTVRWIPPVTTQFLNYFALGFKWSSITGFVYGVHEVHLRVRIGLKSVSTSFIPRIFEKKRCLGMAGCNHFQIFTEIRWDAKILAMT